MKDINTYLTGIALIGALILAISVSGIAYSDNTNSGVAIEQTGENRVDITNHGDTSVNVTVESQLHTFNATVSPDRDLVVPAKSTDNVTVIE